jgi:hypothetical protein
LSISSIVLTVLLVELCLVCNRNGYTSCHNESNACLSYMRSFLSNVSATALAIWWVLSHAA